jgi:hypothetical protein
MTPTEAECRSRIHAAAVRHYPKRTAERACHAVLFLFYMGHALAGADLSDEA